MAVNRIFGAISLSQDTGSLSSIESTIFTDNDMAIARSNSNQLTGGHDVEYDGINFYRWDSSRTDIHNEPFIIKPEDLDAGQSGRWMLISPTHFMENIIVDPNASIIVNDIYGNGSDLQIGYESGSVDITIGSTTITITKNIITDSQIISSIADGTAPITTVSNTLCTGLNANFINGIESTEIILKDGTETFTGVPSLDGALDPITTITDDRHLTSKGYVDNIVTATDEHDETINAASSRIHDEYMFYDGTRAFTGTVGGVTPLAANHLTTKSYVDGIVSGGTIVHATLSGLSSDDHTQYIRVDGTRLFSGVVQMPGVVNTAGVPDIAPTTQYHLTTKKYVDDEIVAASGSDIWVKVDNTDSPISILNFYRYFADTTTASIEFRTIAAPAIGDQFFIDDYKKNSSTNNITVNDNTGSNLLVEGSSATPMIVDVDGVIIKFVYVDGTFGWRYNVT